MTTIPNATVLITGGAGFVGANLAVQLSKRHPEWAITAFDNLYRRGSEMNLPRLEAAGVEFVRGDVRDLDEIEANLEHFDADGTVAASGRVTRLVEVGRRMLEKRQRATA